MSATLPTDGTTAGGSTPSSSRQRRFARIDRLPPYVFNITAELKMAARRRGEDIIDMSMGNPDGATPPHIVAKLTEAAQRPDTHGYSTSRGIPRLRRAISHWYRQRYEVDIDPEREAIVTIGSKEGLAHLMLATLDRGDTVLVPDPSYPIHIYGAVIAGADIRSVPLTPGVDFFAELERAIRGSYPKPKMIVLGFPSNPTAQCVELDFFERVIALARKHDIFVVHDLAYADIVFDGWKAPSILQVPGAKDIAVEFFTLSKSYNMAGWRIGFMAGNADLVAALARIKSYHDYGTFTPLQVAAIAALEGDQQCVRDIAAQYQSRRDVLVRGLHEAGWAVDTPKASMYIWARIPEPYRQLGSLEFSKQLLAKAKVSVSPGIGFGDFGDEYVRFALIENEARIRQAVRGIKSMFRADGLVAPVAAPATAHASATAAKA
ncbi:alanine-synthesizing transaminase [Cupriavidus gilardii J11]|uniref:Alanine-synthesizing transaminase n=1 Tax=Cupriavidus gilardii J11 TaxID=936133 RepID=A0A562B8D4_9BURK|nr:alanine transaminase [Cupriavidus gilardii]TWG81239.1 alanine-synthesizing transaminase [Cupriavidus gilardii J11]